MIVVCFEVISRHVPGENEENDNNLCYNSRRTSADSNPPNMGVVGFERYSNTLLTTNTTITTARNSNYEYNKKNI